MWDVVAREIFGILGSVLIFTSMCFDTSSRLGEVWLRALNLLGSIVYVLYGVMLSAYSSIVMNVILAIVNLFYLIKLLRSKNEEKERD